jgi:hypothetical protein
MGVVTSPYCPSPSQGEGMATSPCLLRRHPSPSQGEGMATSPCRSATSLSFARRGDGNLTLSLCDVPLLRKERGWQPHPVALRRPSPSQGEGRFGGSQNRVRSG